MKTLVIFDVDGTLVKGQSQKVFLKLLRNKNICKFTDYVFISIWFIAYKLSIIKDTNIIREIAYSKLADFNISKLDKIISEEFHLFKNIIYNESYNLINKHKKLNHKLLLISASVDPIIKKLSNEFKIKDYLCTILDVHNNKFTGKILGDALYGSNKRTKIKDYLNNSKIKYDKIIYYADHISDLPIFEFVDIPICVNPDKKLKEIALEKKWEIIHFINNN